MFRWYTADALISKLKLAQRSFQPTSNPGLGCEKFTSLLLDSHHIPSNHFSSFKKAAPFQTGHSCNLVKLGKNFSVTAVTWKYRGTNQDNEKLKNYLFLGVISSCVLFVVYMNLTMEKHQDYVFLEPEEEKNQ